MSNYPFSREFRSLAQKLTALDHWPHTHTPTHINSKTKHMHRRQKTVWKHGGVQHKGIVGCFPRRSNARNVSLWNRYLKHTCTLGKYRQLVKDTVAECINSTSWSIHSKNPVENTGCVQKLLVFYLSLFFPWCVRVHHSFSHRKPTYKFQDTFFFLTWFMAPVGHTHTQEQCDPADNGASSS